MVEKPTYEELEHKVHELEKEAFTRMGVGEALRESEERFRSLVETMSDWIWEVDQNFVYTYVSPKVRDLLGYKPEELLGKTVFDFMPQKAGRRMARKFSGNADSQKPFKAWEKQNLHKDGQLVAMETSGVPVFNASGRFCGYRGIDRDISGRKSEEEENRRLEHQLRQSQKMEAMGTLAGGIAHDFNNILFPIIGYAEMTLYEMPEDSLTRRNLKELLKAANRAKGLVRQILTFSRQTEQERKPLEMQPIIKEALKLIRASLPTTIEIRQSIATETGLVSIDPTQIHQVVMNLCTNAFHAMQEKGGVLGVTFEEVEINSEGLSACVDLSPGTYLKLTVSDTGHGMDREVMDHIFDPYFTTKSPGEGTGMGLAVVHGIVKSHGGKISVYSEPDVGTTFIVYLPRVDTASEASETPPTEMIPRGTESVLFVDDESQVIGMVKQMLESLGYYVTAYPSSLEAFEEFCMEPEAFDLVITDQTMPNMTGMELARKLMGIRPDIPVILCTGFSELVNEEKAKAIGIRAFVMKPLVIRDFAITVRKVLDEM